MNKTTRTLFDKLRSPDGDARYRTFLHVLEETDKRVDWAYEVWDQLVEGLHDGDNHQRAIAAQVLANLAKSDPQNRMAKAFPALLKLTRDEKFVTARHCLQSLWKVGAAGVRQRESEVV